jgi:hypothetical protein
MLKFVDGAATATTQNLYDHLDFSCGIEVFLDFVPAISMESPRMAPPSDLRSRSTRSWCVFSRREAAWA